MEGVSRVRFAQQDDEEEIMTMCERLHGENGLFPLVPDKVRQVLRRAFDREGGILGVVGEAGRIEGSICLTLDQFWYSDDWFLNERWNYVLPEYRRSTNAKDMIKFAQMTADEIKVPLIIGVLSNERTEAKVELYKRSLGKPAGAFWVQNGAWSPQGNN